MVLPVDMMLMVVLPSRLRTYTQPDQSVGTKKMVLQRRTYAHVLVLRCNSVVVGLHSGMRLWIDPWHWRNQNVVNVTQKPFSRYHLKMSEIQHSLVLSTPLFTCFHMVLNAFFYDFQLVLDETYQHKIEPGCRHILAFDILTCRIYPHVFTLESKVCLSWGIVLPLYNHKPYPMLKPPGFHCVSGELRTELT